MYKIKCKICEELNQLHDRMKNCQIFCYACGHIIQEKKIIILVEKPRPVEVDIKETIKKEKKTTQICSECKSEINIEATTCKFCGGWPVILWQKCLFYVFFIAIFSFLYIRYY